MNTPFLPVVAREIWLRYPDYRALSITARGFYVGSGLSSHNRMLTPPAWIEEHIEAWRNAFRAFGANPKKTPCSVEALWKRLQKNGALPAINPVVDLYNALSIRFGAPFGGEDADQYIGAPRLDFSIGDEAFDTSRDGSPVIEHPEKGEMVWRDEQGVTCRRWNWRQCRRTALSETSRNLWFVIDRLPPMPLDQLERAGEALVLGLREICPTVETTISFLEPGTE
jgi:DNA/RNA-binding domain of Phe-tRNA-synthetase-like protein